MINNEVLKRIHYIFAFNEADMLTIFKAADSPVSPAQITNWLAKDGTKDYQKCGDLELIAFLDGLINFKRGKKEGAQAQPDERINNNIIFRKLKIALNMKNAEVLEIMDLAAHTISPHELTALFRKKTHKHYRVCKDEVLIKFLTGLKIKYRDMEEAGSEEE